jgi:hypothetical protein
MVFATMDIQHQITAPVQGGEAKTAGDQTQSNEDLDSTQQICTIEAIRPYVEIHAVPIHLPLTHIKLPTSSIEMLSWCTSTECGEMEPSLASSWTHSTTKTTKQTRHARHTCLFSSLRKNTPIGTEPTL